MEDRECHGRAINASVPIMDFRCAFSATSALPRPRGARTLRAARAGPAGGWGEGGGDDGVAERIGRLRPHPAGVALRAGGVAGRPVDGEAVHCRFFVDLHPL